MASSGSHRDARQQQIATVFNTVIESVGMPMMVIYKFALESRQPYDVPRVVQLVAGVFNVFMTVRGRSGKKHVTVFGYSDSVVRHVAEYMQHLDARFVSTLPRPLDIWATVTVKLVSAGVRTLGLHEHCPMAGVRHELSSRLPEPVDYCIDVRNFADPYFSKDVSGHAGTHPKIQMGIVMTTDFVDKLRFTKNILRDFSGQRHVTLALVCKSGRHRSVAFAELLRSSLMRIGFWVDMMHYSAMIGQWRYICQGYNGCPECAWSDDHWTMHNLVMELFTLC